MGATIEAVATVRSPGGVRKRGAIKLSDEAALACLERANRPPRDLDFLINAGVYRDRNVGEPAIAAIIQEDIGANPDPPLEGGHGTFSLDIANGGCGSLTAMHVLDGFISSGAIDVGMVVAADAPPDARDRKDFPFPRVGAAALLSRSTVPDTGFTHFASATFPEYANLFESSVEWEQSGARRALADRVPGVRPGHNTLHLVQHEGYARRCVTCATAVARDFLRTVSVHPSEVDLLVPSPTPGSFPDDVSRALEVPSDRVARIDERYAGAHTAGPIAALEGVMRTGALAGARNVLFVTVGAGITVSLALYRPAPPPRA